MTALGYFVEVASPSTALRVVMSSFVRVDYDRTPQLVRRARKPAPTPAPSPKPKRLPNYGPDGTDKRWLLVRGRRCLICGVARISPNPAHSDRLYRGVCTRCRESKSPQHVAAAIRARGGDK